MKSTEIMNEFRALSSSEQVAVLLSALEYMESYNGRNRSYCICMAMGYSNDTGDINGWYK